MFNGKRLNKQLQAIKHASKSNDTWTAVKNVETDLKESLADNKNIAGYVQMSSSIP
jgi:ATP/maltotriose-dependent transcriptional regulator MalT